MANGNGDRSLPTVGMVITILGLVATIVGGAMGFHGRVMSDVQERLSSELRHIVTRDELADLRRVQESTALERHHALIRRLDALDTKISRIERKVGQ